MIIYNIVLLLIGLVLVLLGAEGLVRGASSLAKKWGVSEFVIGLTIVAMGTSMPEMVVSVISSIDARADMAVGNIVGSNIFNTAFILGLSALLCPIIVTKNNIKVDIPINIAASVILILTGLSGTLFHAGAEPNTLTRVDGIVLLVLFAAYLWYTMKHDDPEASDDDEIADQKTWLSVLYVIGGLAGLVAGGQLFVKNAEVIAQSFGLSDKFIGVTILALGTSLPELATSIVAAAEGKSQMALGNILGSNVFNILLILGVASLFNPLEVKGLNAIDFCAVLGVSIIVLFGAILSKKKQLRFGTGTCLILTGVAYMAYVIASL